MPGVGLVQETGAGTFQLFLPFQGADVVVPLLTKTPKVRRDAETIARRAAMAAPTVRQCRPAVTVGAAPTFSPDGDDAFMTWVSPRETLSQLAQFEAAVSRQDGREAALGSGVPALKSTSPALRLSRRRGKTVVTPCNS